MTTRIRPSELPARVVAALTTAHSAALVIRPELLTEPVRLQRTGR